MLSVGAASLSMMVTVEATPVRRPWVTCSPLGSGFAPRVGRNHTSTVSRCASRGPSYTSSSMIVSRYVKRLLSGVKMSFSTPFTL